MALDRLIALIFLVIAIVYGIAAFNYPLLPFEKHLPVLPNTLPKALSVIAALISLFILIMPTRSVPEPGVDSTESQPATAKTYAQTGALVLTMVAYALLLRPVGFIIATTSFIAGASILLGERKFVLIIPVALATAFAIWWLVDQLLGIFLKPWPGFIG